MHRHTKKGPREWEREERGGQNTALCATTPEIQRNVTRLIQPVVRASRLERSRLMGSSTLEVCRDPWPQKFFQNLLWIQSRSRLMKVTYHPYKGTGLCIQWKVGSLKAGQPGIKSHSGNTGSFLESHTPVAQYWLILLSTRLCYVPF